MASVILPRSLAALIPGVERRTTASGATVGEVIASLDARWPGIADRLCDSGPAIRDYINVFVDGDRVASLDHAVGPDATIHVIPAVAGGAGGGAKRREVAGGAAVVAKRREVVD